jgi:hypothetical protein
MIYGITEHMGYGTQKRVSYAVRPTSDQQHAQGIREVWKYHKATRYMIYLRSSSCSHAAMLVKSCLQLVMACNPSPIRAPRFSLTSFMVSDREESNGGQIVFRWRSVWAPRRGSRLKDSGCYLKENSCLFLFFLFIKNLLGNIPWRITKKLSFT